MNIEAPTLNRFLTRSEGISVLYEVINSGILDDAIEANLTELANLLQYELEGEHLWGQPYSACDKLHVAYREDLWTDELVKECQKQHDNVRFIPSPTEIPELKEHYMEMCEVDEDDAIAMEQFEKDFNNYYHINPIH